METIGIIGYIYIYIGVYIRVILGYYSDNGRENGNHYSILGYCGHGGNMAVGVFS